MVSRVTASLVLVAAIFVASERPVSSACILVNAPSKKSCAPACCAKKFCCHASQKKTTEPVQPLATPNSQQQNFVALAQVVSSERVEQLWPRETSGFSITEYS